MMQTRGDKEKSRRPTNQSVTRLISRGANAYFPAGMPMQSKSPAVSPSLSMGGVVQRQQEEDEVEDADLTDVADKDDVVQRQVMPGVTAHLPAAEPSARDDELVDSVLPEEAPNLKDTEPVEPIQRKEAPQQDALSHLIRQEAQHGVRTPSSGLPYAQQVQKAFGRHDVSHIQAHLGEKASASALAMNAAAYATGNHVVFAGEPDLHTVAHEAAHIVQQQGGVQLAGGTGKIGDVYEQHADAVANQVVAGQTAEALLDQFAGDQTRAPSQEIQSSPSAPEAGGVVQRVNAFSYKLRKQILAANKKKNGGLHTCTHCGLSHALATFVKKTGGRAVGDGGFHVDHIKPKSKGGKGTLKNGRVLCGTCNTSRGNRKKVGVTGYAKYRGLDGKKKLKVISLAEYALRKKNWDKKGTPVV
jgi:hypothetical protein